MPSGGRNRIATLFGQVTVPFPRYRCAECRAGEAGVGWPSNCRSTPEPGSTPGRSLSPLMTYRVAASVLEQMFPVDAGKSHETLRAHTLKLGEQLQDRAVIAPTTAATAIAISVDSTFIGSCEEANGIWRSEWAMSGMVPHRDAAAAPEANSRRIVRG